MKRCGPQIVSISWTSSASAIAGKLRTPVLLAEHVADEVVFVQPLHDDDDGAALLIVLPAVEGVVVPLVGGLPLRLGERLLRLQRIVEQDDVGAGPVSSPPMEVASR